jgi:hypothetical protein
MEDAELTLADRDGFLDGSDGFFVVDVVLGFIVKSQEDQVPVGLQLARVFTRGLEFDEQRPQW